MGNRQWARDAEGNRQLAFDNWREIRASHVQAWGSACVGDMRSCVAYGLLPIANCLLSSYLLVQTNMKYFWKSAMERRSRPSPELLS